MSFRDEVLTELGVAGLEEFGECVTHVPTCRLPNQRPGADPNRPAYELDGIFDKNADGTRPYDARLQPGREIAKRVPSIQPVLCIRDCDLAWPVVEADEFIISGERYRVMDVRRDSEGMTRCHLEIMGRPVPA